MANPTKVRIASSGSGYTAQLRGVAGTNTAGIVLQGTYQSGWDMHVFDVLVSGPYELWFDPNGGSTYSKDSVWSGSTGKLVFGQDMIDSLQP